jgi:hypothetical protein
MNLAKKLVLLKDMAGNYIKTLALKVSSLILPWKNTLHESSLTGSLNLKT